MEDLEKAISDEEGAISFYMKLEKKIGNATFARVIHSIAVDEMQHLETLKDLKDKISMLERCGE